MAAPTRPLLFVFLAGCLAFWTSLYAYAAILPIYSSSLGVSVELIGLIVAAYGAPQVLLRVPLGIWSDVLRRRKPFAVASGLFCAAGGLLFLTAASGDGLIAARAAHGVGAAMWVLITVLFVSYFPARDVVRAMGWLTAIASGAQLVCAVAGGVLAQELGWAAPFWLSFAAGVIAAVVLALVPEVRPPPAPPFSFGRFVEIARVPLLLITSLLALLIVFATFATTYGFLPVHATRIGASPAEVGWLTTLQMASSLVASALLSPVVRRLGEVRTVALGLAVGALALALVPLATSLLALAAIHVALGLSRGWTYPVAMGLSVRAVAAGDRATAMGIFQAIYSIGIFAGPALTGVVAGAIGLDAGFYLSSALCAVGLGIAVLGRGLFKTP